MNIHLTIQRRIAQAWIAIVFVVAAVLYAESTFIVSIYDWLLLLGLCALAYGSYRIIKKPLLAYYLNTGSGVARKHTWWRSGIALWLILSTVLASVYILVTGDFTIAHLVELEFNSLRIIVVHLLLLFVWALIGMAIMKAFAISMQGRLQTLLLSVVVGMSFAILLYYVLVNLQYVSLLPLIICAILAGLYMMKNRKVWQQLPSEPVSSKQFLYQQWLLIGVTILFATLVFINVSHYEPRDGDSLRAYYTIPHQMVLTNGPVEYIFDAFNNSPLTSSYLYIPYILLGNEYLVYINVFLLMLVIATVYCITKEMFSEQAALFAAFIPLSINLIQFHALSVRTDLFLALLILWGSYFVWHSTEYPDKARKSLIIAGFLVGIALAVKYSTTLVIPPLILVILLFSTRQGWKRRFVGSMTFIITISLVYGLWGVPLASKYQGDFLYPALTALSTRQESQLYRKFYDEFKLVQFSEREGLPWYQNVWALFSNNVSYPNNKVGPIIAAAFLLLPLALGSRSVQLLSVLIYGTMLEWYSVAPQDIVCVYALLLAAIALGYVLEHFIPRRLYTTLLMILLALALVQIPLGYITRIEHRFSNRAEDYPAWNSANNIEYVLNEYVEKKEPNYAVLPIGFVRAGLIHNSYKHTTPILFYALSPSEWYIARWTNPLFTDEPFASVRKELLDRGITHLYVDKAYMKLYLAQACAKSDCAISRRINQHVQEAASELVPIADTERWVLYHL